MSDMFSEYFKEYNNVINICSRVVPIISKKLIYMPLNIRYRVFKPYKNYIKLFLSIIEYYNNFIPIGLCY